MSAHPSVRAAMPLTERLLPLLQVLALISLGFQLVDQVPRLLSPSPGEEAVALFFLGVLVVAWVVPALAWIARARTRSPRLRSLLAVVVLIVATLGSLFGTLGPVYPLLQLSLALLVLDISRRAGAIGWGVMALAAPILLAAIGQPMDAVLFTLFGIGALEGFGFVLGLLLRGLEERGEADRLLIAERDHALAQLEAAMERVRRGAETEKELVLADERTRAARDLHDGLGHRLTLISMSLDFAERMREKNAQAAWTEVATARGTAVEAMGEMRTWVRALSPVRDPEATGLAAFDAIAESFRGTGLDVRVEHHGDADRVELDADASLLLYRTVQEGLTNALRHGHATTMAIDVTAEASAVTVTMTNDLDDEAQAAVPEGLLPHGFGLRGLTDRAKALGGSANAARHGDQVVLTVSVPVAGQMTSAEGAR